MEGPVEPATGEDAEQCRNHDGPAQCSDHGEVLAQRPFALALPALAEFLPSSDRLSQPLVIFGLRHDSSPSCDIGPASRGTGTGRSGRRKR